MSSSPSVTARRYSSTQRTRIPTMRQRLLVTCAVFMAACYPGAHDRGSSSDELRVPQDRLPTGVRLDPVGRAYDVGSLPLSMTPSPDGKHFVIVLSGYADQGFQIVERSTGRVVQTVIQRAAFLGAAFSADGRELFVSGGDRDVIYRYAWNQGAA